MILQSPSNIFDMTKSLMKLQEKYLESIRIDYKLSRIEVIHSTACAMTRFSLQRLASW